MAVTAGGGNVIEKMSGAVLVIALFALFFLRPQCTSLQAGVSHVKRSRSPVIFGSERRTRQKRSLSNPLQFDPLGLEGTGGNLSDSSESDTSSSTESSSATSLDGSLQHQAQDDAVSAGISEVSSDEEFAVQTFQQLGSVTRSVWKLNRNQGFWNDIRGWSEWEFKHKMRLAPQTFRRICDALAEDVNLKKEDTNFRKAYTVDQRIAAAIYFFGQGMGYSGLETSTGISDALLSDVVPKVAMGIIQEFESSTIRFPATEEELRTAEYKFRNVYGKGIPFVVGAVDGSHIPIRAPPGRRRAQGFVNRKGWHSLVLQGVVDHQGRFTDVYTGWAGSVHDQRVYKHSRIYERFARGEFGNYCLLGDAGYALSSYTLIPYIDNGHLSNNQKFFNEKHSSTRGVVERAFGQLKRRFRILARGIETNIYTATAIIVACCILHNLCIDENDGFESEWDEQPRMWEYDPDWREWERALIDELDAGVQGQERAARQAESADSRANRAAAVQRRDTIALMLYNDLI